MPGGTSASPNQVESKVKFALACGGTRMRVILPSDVDGWNDATVFISGPKKLVARPADSVSGDLAQYVKDKSSPEVSMSSVPSEFGGDPMFAYEVTIGNIKQKFTPHELVYEFLRAEIAPALRGYRVRKMVIPVPSKSSTHFRLLSTRAVALAMDLDEGDVVCVPECICNAIRAVICKQCVGGGVVADDSTLLIDDGGGGTFDLAIVRWSDNLLDCLELKSHMVRTLYSIVISV
jgi:hypothetical protein